MIRLVRPDLSRHLAWSECLAEIGDGPADGSGFMTGDVPTGVDDFRAYVENRALMEDRDEPMAPGLVHCSFRWIVDDAWADGGPLLGFLAVRHALTRPLWDAHGHVGYSVRPSARGRGIAGEALRAGLAEATDLGTDPVLVTCHRDNDASRRVLEKAGGRLENVIDDHLRFWFGAEAPPPRPAEGATV